MGELGLLLSDGSNNRGAGTRARAFSAAALLLALIAATSSVRAQSADGTAEARALEQQGKNVEAEAAWRLVLKTHPASAEAYAHLGLLEARQQNYKEAVPLYRRALALNPAMPGVGLNLGLALFKSDQLKEAIQEFTLLKAKAPDSPEVQRFNILIGMAHYGLGDYATASRFLKQAAAVDTQNLELRLALAHSCLWSKQYQCVLDTYHQMLTLNAESAEADMLAGEAEDAMKDYEGAIAQFRAAEKVDPKEPSVHFGLGYILWTQREYTEAATEFQAELANDPNQVQALVYLGDAEIQLNHPELASPLLEKAAGLDTKLELAHLDLGIVYGDAGRKDDALRELNTAEKLAPSDVNVHWRLGRLYREMGKKVEAKAEFAKASSLHKATDDALVDRISGGHEKANGNPTPQPQ